MQKEKFVFGIISDTHGKISQEALDALQGVELIIHAGDVEIARTLDDLRKIAPVYAVRGNMDLYPDTKQLPFTQAVEVGDKLVYVVHILQDLDINPKAAGFSAVIYGHTHQPEVVNRNGILFINPGSASYPRRVPNPSVAIGEVVEGKLDVRIVELAN